MDKIELWRLSEELSISDAALLIVDIDPGNWEFGLNGGDEPDGYSAVVNGIIGAIRRGKIKVRLTSSFDTKAVDRELGFAKHLPSNVSLYDTFVDVDNLISWLEARGWTTGYFFPEAPRKPDFLDKGHPHYASKLAAAVSAWLAVGANLNPNKKPKQQIKKWLNENAAQFDLTDDDGKPKENAIESVAQIANWDTQGGAPKTIPKTDDLEPTVGLPEPEVSSIESQLEGDLDDEIPF